MMVKMIDVIDHDHREHSMKVKFFLGREGTASSSV